MGDIKYGFEPFYFEDSALLVLGSFPSVKSRQTEFYYGNRQNRFWKTISEFFGEETPPTLEDKKSLLKRRKIALWDIVTQCEIVGSQDNTIKNFHVADLCGLLQNLKIRLIIINGGKAYDIFLKNYCDIGVPYICLPSTSPANTHFDKEKWFDALRRVFERA